MFCLKKTSIQPNPFMQSVKAPENKKIAEFVQRWGYTGSSITLLDPDCSIFSAPSIEGVIGYRTSYGTAIAFGDPVCPEENKTKLAQAFYEHCQQLGKNVIYVTTSERFAKWAIKNTCKAMIEIGEELVLDPHLYPKEGSNGRLLRKKMNHSHHAGVTVHEYFGGNEHLKSEIEQVGNAWLRGRHGPQIFLAHVNLFKEGPGKRWFYAIQNGLVVGALSLNQLQARQGWVVNLLMVTPDAPGGTSEYLVLTALDALAKEECHYLTFGATPSEQLGEIVGLTKVSSTIARTLFKATKKTFHLDGRRLYWKKFEPKSDRSYILFGKSHISLKDIIAIMKALNVGF